MATANNVIPLGVPERKNLPNLEMKRNTLLGELVVATGADRLPLDVLAGLLLTAVEAKSHHDINAWASRGADFFEGVSEKLQ